MPEKTPTTPVRSFMPMFFDGNDFDRLFAEMVPTAWRTDKDESGLMTMGSLAIDMIEGEEGYTITAELAAIKPEDVKIEVDGNVLTIRGERKSEHEERNKDDKVIRSERFFGTVERKIQLPAEADADAASADMQDGLLTLTVPRKAVVPEDGPKTIAITQAAS